MAQKVRLLESHTASSTVGGTLGSCEMRMILPRPAVYCSVLTDMRYASASSSSSSSSSRGGGGGGGVEEQKSEAEKQKHKPKESDKQTQAEGRTGTRNQSVENRQKTETNSNNSKPQCFKILQRVLEQASSGI